LIHVKTRRGLQGGGKRGGASRDKIDSAPSGATLTVAATANRSTRSGAASTEFALADGLRNSPRQPGDIAGDPPRATISGVERNEVNPK